MAGTRAALTPAVPGDARAPDAKAQEGMAATMAQMMPGGGYGLSPTHQLQDNSPTENVLAMYAAAFELGRY